MNLFYDIVNKSTKKLPLICAIGLAIVMPLKAATISSTVFTNGIFTNFPGLPQGPIQVRQVVLANNTSNTQTVYLYDVPTNSLTNVVPAYTNTVSYLTNYLFILTNYYGNIVTNTNTVLFDNTNNSVASITNSIAPRMILTAAANNSTRFDQVNYYFYSGLWISNATSFGAGTNGALAITITYQ